MSVNLSYFLIPKCSDTWHCPVLVTCIIPGRLTFSAPLFFFSLFFFFFPYLFLPTFLSTLISSKLFEPFLFSTSLFFSFFFHHLFLPTFLSTLISSKLFDPFLFFPLISHKEPVNTLNIWQDRFRQDPLSTKSMNPPKIYTTIAKVHWSCRIQYNENSHWHLFIFSRSSTLFDGQIDLISRNVAKKPLPHYITVQTASRYKSVRTLFFY